MVARLEANRLRAPGARRGVRGGGRPPPPAATVHPRLLQARRRRLDGRPPQARLRRRPRRRRRAAAHRRRLRERLAGVGSRRHAPRLHLHARRPLGRRLSGGALRARRGCRGGRAEAADPGRRGRGPGLVLRRRVAHRLHLRARGRHVSAPRPDRGDAGRRERPPHPHGLPRPAVLPLPARARAGLGRRPHRVRVEDGGNVHLYTVAADGSRRARASRRRRAVDRPLRPRRRSARVHREHVRPPARALRRRPEAHDFGRRRVRRRPRARRGRAVHGRSPPTAPR